MSFNGLFAGLQSASWLHGRQDLGLPADLGLRAVCLEPEEVVKRLPQVYGLRRSEVRQVTHDDRRAVRKPVAGREVAPGRQGR